MTTNALPLVQAYHQAMRETYPPPTGQFYIHDLPAEHINERFLHYLWAERFFQAKPFQTVDGLKVAVKHPGLWNQERGPDFKQARVFLDNELREGDIEIHLYTSDWYRHRHHTDPHYNNVMLHISGWHDNDTNFVQTADGKKVPQIILAPFLESQFEEIDQFLEGEFHPKHARFGGQGQCSQFCLNPDLRTRLVEFMEMAGETRLAHKAERFRDRLAQSKARNYNEVLYQGVMEALGYYTNQANFAELAHCLSWSVLNNILSKPLDEPRPIVIQALLLHQAGLVPNKPWGNFDEATRSYLSRITRVYQTFSQISSQAEVKPLAWKFKGTRPLNYPHRRLAGASYFLSQMASNDLPAGQAGMISRLLTHGQELSSGLTDCFRPDASDYWLTHTNFNSKPLKKPVALVGEDRLRIIEVNVIIPMLILYAQENSQPVQSLIRYYKDYPLLSDNYITNFMKYRLFADKKTPVRKIVRTAFCQQGLIQIYRDFCSRGYEGCEYCAFLKWLSRKA